MRQCNWVIIGTGTIADEMAKALLAFNGKIYGVYNHHIEKGRIFAEKYHIKRVFHTLEEVLQDQQADIVYIAVPHHLHYDIMMKALQYKKHVLCEKAIAINSAQLSEAAVLAQKNKVVLAEAMTIYHMPLYQEVKAVIEAGAIGRIKMIQVNFGSCKPYDTENRFFKKELAGGALLDIGTYAVSFARYFMHKYPDTLWTEAEYSESGVDESSGILLKNNMGEMAVISLSFRAKQPKRGVIAGEKGYIEIYDYPRADEAAIYDTQTGEKEILRAGESGKALIYEVEHMQKSVCGCGDDTELKLSMEVMDILTEIRKKWGYTYPFEHL